MQLYNFTRLALGLVLVLMWLIGAPRLYAADQVVTNCSSDTDLRNKINALQTSGGGTLSFNCGVATIVLTGGVLPPITGNITIDGGGSITLSGNSAARIFNVASGAMLSLNNLTLTKAHGAGDGGAIYNNGTLLVAYSKFIDNTADASGGAIVTYGVLTITQSEFANNRGANGGAVYPRFSQAVTHITYSNFHDNETTSTTDGWGGAILLWDGAPVTIEHSVFNNNKARSGGAIYVFRNSTLAFSSSTAAYNQATAMNGGAIENHGTTNITDSTIQYNSASNVGGGVMSDSGFTLTKSTLDHNTASAGGGLYNWGAGPTITNVTFSGNSAQFGGAIYNVKANVTLSASTLYQNSATLSGGGIESNTYSGQKFMVKNTVIVKGASGENCNDGQSPPTLTSEGFNLSDDNSCTAFFNKVGDRNNTAAMLNALANNGGATQTHLPQTASPLIDNGGAIGAPSTDQRGISRPQGAAVDIGAVEVCQMKPAPPVLRAPKNNKRVKGPQVTLKWNPGTCVQTYTVMLKLGSPQGSKVQKKAKLSDALFVTKALVKGQTYYWQVTAVGDAGKTKSDWRSFNVK